MIFDEFIIVSDGAIAGAVLAAAHRAVAGAELSPAQGPSHGQLGEQLHPKDVRHSAVEKVGEYSELVRARARWRVLFQDPQDKGVRVGGFAAILQALQHVLLRQAGNSLSLSSTCTVSTRCAATKTTSSSSTSSLSKTGPTCCPKLKGSK